MLNYNSPIKKHINYNDVSVKEVYPVMKLNLRGKKREFFTAAGKQLDMILPTEANTSSSSSKLTSIWLSPDEWMIVSNDPLNIENNNYEIEKILFNKVSKTNLGSVTDVSDQFVSLNLKGQKIFDLLSMGCPFNFNEFKNKKGSVVQTILSHIDVIIHLTEINEVNLFVRRSFSKHLHSWMSDSASRL